MFARLILARSFPTENYYFYIKKSTFMKSAVFKNFLQYLEEGDDVIRPADVAEPTQIAKIHSVMELEEFYPSRPRNLCGE